MRELRFDWIAATAVGAITAPRTWSATAQTFEADMPIVDTHVHCFAGLADKRFPYADSAPYRPQRPATPERLLQLMDGAGVDYAIIVHPEPYGDDHRYLEHCLQVGGKRLKGTCLFFADRPGGVDQLPELAQRIPLVAARVHAYAPERLPPFDSPEMKRLWRLASDAGLAMQIHFEPRYAPAFESLIREFSGMTVLIDHLGRPLQGTKAEHAVVLAWSRAPNTIMKLSSVPSADVYPHRQIGPIVKSLADAFGPERLMYGGGFSEDATAESYRAERERVAELLAPWQERDIAMVLGGNAARIFGFGK